MLELILLAMGATIQCLSVIIADPLLPNFSNTLSLGYFEINFVLISPTILFTSMSGSILSNYVQFGDMQSKFQRSSLGIGQSLPPQSNITVFPFDFAYLAASSLIFTGTYFCKSKQFPVSIAFKYSAGNYEVQASYLVFAPPTITIEFYPEFSSTQINAFPVVTSFRILQLNQT